MTGTLRRFLDARGFGFIEPDNSDEPVFVHVTAARASGVELREGLRLEFMTELDRSQRLRAIRLRVIG